ncbi:MAG: insulinase family protein, partial [Chloroflexi bacterium]|nr:insulinase family protein [Chloroflexota bacterium]
MNSFSFDKFTLSNGLDVILQEDHALPVAAVNIWYHVGSKDEEPGRTGFAHLFEHVMFEGSKNHNQSFFDPLQKVGAVLNGSTSNDRTNYWEDVPSNYLELALWLESDRMGFLLDALDQGRFDIQREVVKNERRQSYENRPYGMAGLVLQSAVFPTPHPYSWPVIGSQEDLDSAALEDIHAFFRRFYAPTNASLAIVGDIDLARVKDMVERYFGDIPPGPSITRVGKMDSDLRGRVSLTMQDRVQLARLYLVWPTSPAFSEDEAPLDMLSTVLGDGKSSRFYRSLVYEKQIAKDARVMHHAQEIAGEFHIQVTANPGHSLEEIEEAVRFELDRIVKEPPTEKEMTRARNRVQSHYVRQTQKFGGFGGRADLLNSYNTYLDDPGYMRKDLDRYLAVSSEDVVRVASTVLGRDHVGLSVLPEESLSAASSVVDRASAPAASGAPSFEPPVPERLHHPALRIQQRPNQTRAQQLTAVHDSRKRRHHLQRGHADLLPHRKRRHRVPVPLRQRPHDASRLARKLHPRRLAEPERPDGVVNHPIPHPLADDSHPDVAALGDHILKRNHPARRRVMQQPPTEITLPLTAVEHLAFLDNPRRDSPRRSERLEDAPGLVGVAQRSVPPHIPPPFTVTVRVKCWHLRHRQNIARLRRHDHGHAELNLK